MKKIFIVLMTCSFLLSFAACGKDNGNETSDGSTQTQSASDSTTEYGVFTFDTDEPESVTQAPESTQTNAESTGTTASSGAEIEASLSKEQSPTKPANGTTADKTDAKATTTSGNKTTVKSTAKVTVKTTAAKTTAKSTTAKATTAKLTTKPTAKPATTKPSTTKPTTTKPTTTKPTETTTAVGSGIVDSDIPSDSYVAKYVVPVFKSGTYTITMSITDSVDGTAKTTLATSGGKTSMISKFDGVDSKMIMADGHMYVCMPVSAMAVGMSDEEVSMFRTLLGISKNGGIYIDLNKLNGDTDEYVEQFGGILSAFSVDGLKFVSRSNVTKNGVTYICEEYKAENSTVKFYFNSTALKMIEQTQSVSGKTSTETIMIDSISSTVASDAFSLPKGYKDVTSLLNMISAQG